MTLGGYVESDIDGEVEWYLYEESDTANADVLDSTWTLPLTTMDISGLDLLAAPTVDVDAKTERLVNAVDPFPCYAHFNTGYPFIGVDENV